MAKQTSTLYQKGSVLFTDFKVLEVYVGGMAEVYCGIEESSSNMFAMKTLKRGLEGNPQAHLLFEEEVRKWIKMGSHPNIVQCHRFEYHRFQPFLALEWILRTDANNRPMPSDLRTLLASGPIRPAQTLKILIDICHGLQHVANRLGVVPKARTGSLVSASRFKLGWTSASERRMHAFAIIEDLDVGEHLHRDLL